jgi:hypothetical protein
LKALVGHDHAIVHSHSWSSNRQKKLTIGKVHTQIAASSSHAAIKKLRQRQFMPT